MMDCAPSATERDGAPRIPPPLPARPPPIARINQRLRQESRSVSVDTPSIPLKVTLPDRPKSLPQSEVTRSAECPRIPQQIVPSSREDGSSFEMNALLAPTEMSWDENWDDLTDEVESIPFAVDEKMLLNHSDMASVENRLATFHNWPQNHPQQPKTFAKYGMFYTGNGDRTQCYSCGVVIWGWEPYQGDPKAPIRAHKKFHPECKFLRARAWSDTISTLKPTGMLLNLDKADAPHMISEEARQDSFKILPVIDVTKNSEIAQAGFYLTADYRKVACFYCGVASLLAAIENPWLTHARLSPSCTFLKRKRGPHFIRKANRKSTIENEEIEHDHNGTSSASVNESAANTMIKTVMSKVQGIPGFVSRKNLNSIGKMAKSFWNGSPRAEDAAQDPIDNISVQSEIRFPSSGSSSSLSSISASLESRANIETRSMENVVIQQRSSGQQLEVNSVRTLVTSSRAPIPVHSDLDDSNFDKVEPGSLDMIVATASGMGFSRKQIQEAIKEHKIRGSITPLTVDVLVELVLDLSLPVGMEEPAASVPSDVNKLNDRVELPDQERFCVICMENPADHVFTPCGHLKTCGKCSEMVKECPLCRHTIQARIRVYL